MSNKDITEKKLAAINKQIDERRKPIENVHVVGEILKGIKRRGFSHQRRSNKQITPADGRVIFNAIIETREYKFDADEYNNEIIDQLILYFLAHHECKYDLFKGIYLWGARGRGKSELMRMFQVFTAECKRLDKFSIENCREISDNALENGPYVVRRYTESSKCFDNLGRESLCVEYFKNTVNPMELAIDYAYNRHQRDGLLFHATSEIPPAPIDGKPNVKSLMDFYGERMGEMAHEMFNFINIKGPNRRKNYE